MESTDVTAVRGIFEGYSTNSASVWAVKKVPNFISSWPVW
jgi:hypothetical protein